MKHRIMIFSNILNFVIWRMMPWGPVPIKEKGSISRTKEETASNFQLTAKDVKPADTHLERKNWYTEYQHKNGAKIYKEIGLDEDDIFDVFQHGVDSIPEDMHSALKQRIIDTKYHFLYSVGESMNTSGRWGDTLGYTVPDKRNKKNFHIGLSTTEYGNPQIEHAMEKRKHVLVHEMGHVAHGTDLPSGWEKISSGTPAPSSRAGVSPREDFAESFALFVTKDRDFLENHKQRANFMSNYIRTNKGE